MKLPTASPPKNTALDAALDDLRSVLASGFPGRPARGVDIPRHPALAKPARGADIPRRPANADAQAGKGAAERFAALVAQHQRRLPRAEAVLKAANEQPDLSRAAWREQHAAANTLAALCKQVARPA